MNNSRELATIISLLLLILFRQSSTALLCQCFKEQRIKRRRLCLRFINTIAHSIYFLTARQNNCAYACAPKSVWVLPRPQMWFQQLLNSHALDHLWKGLERKLQIYSCSFRVHNYASLLDQHFELLRRQQPGDWWTVNVTANVDWWLDFPNQPWF